MKGDMTMKMTLFDLYTVSPQSFVFVRCNSGRLVEYNGGAHGKFVTLKTVKATEYPMYKSVLECTVDDPEDYFLQNR